MPAKSKAQWHMMKAAAKNPEFAKRVGISQKVAAEFVEGQSPKGLPARKPPALSRKKK